MIGRGSQNKADIHAVIGATGAGKGRYIKTELLPRYAGRQVFVWSVLEGSDNYAGVLKCRAVESLSEMIAEYRAGKSCVFVPPKVISRRDLDRFEGLFSLWCRAVERMSRCFALVEELSRVTSPSFAPDAWSDLSTACRHGGLALGATAQRPAQVDKNFLSGATEIRCFRVGEKADARVMAEKLDVEWPVIMRLPDFHFVHRFVRDARSVSGVLGEKSQKTANNAKKVTARRPVKSCKKP